MPWHKSIPWQDMRPLLLYSKFWNGLQTVCLKLCQDRFANIQATQLHAEKTNMEHDLYKQ